MGTAKADRSGETFKEKALLLLLTAVLTGFLIPVVNSVLAEQRSRRERSEAAALAKRASAEAESLAKQASLIRAQEAFLIQLERTIFEFHTKAAAVPWYRSQQPDLAKYRSAREVYDGASWKFMADMHAALSMAKRLTSPATFKILDAHQRKWETLDLELSQLPDDSSSEAWLSMLHRVNRQAIEASEVLEALARDYGLARPSAVNR